MKTLNNFTYAILCLLILFSCYNEDDSLTKEANHSLKGDVRLVTLPIPQGGIMKGGTQYSGQFLSFDTYEDFETVYNQLEAAMDANDFYIRQMVGVVADEDELDAKFIQYNLDEYKPLKNFENQYGLNSLRKDIYDKETVWLSQQSDIFDEEDPDDHFIFDSVLRTLLNKDGEVMIAGKIHRLENWGRVEIANMNAEAYYNRYPCDYNGSDPDVGIEPLDKANPCNIDPQSGGGGYPPTDGCQKASNMEQEFITSTRRKMKIQSKLQQASIYILRSNRFIARTRYFKKVGAVWFRKKADLYVKMEGTHGYQSNCYTQDIAIFKEKQRYGGSVEVKYTNPKGWFSMETMSIRRNSLYSTHKLWGGNTKVKRFYEGL